MKGETIGGTEEKKLMKKGGGGKKGEKKQYDEVMSINKQDLAKHITKHANGEPLLKRSSSFRILPHFHNDSACCPVCQWWLWCSSKASSKVNFQNDNTYQLVCVTVIVSSFRQKK